jgi:ribosomal protein S18 acetylase RimI-like enzyme
MIIKKLDKEHVQDVQKVDGTFTINSVLTLHLENNTLTYTVEEVPQAEKRYKKDDTDYTTYVDNPEKIIYLAYVKDTLAGHIILRKNWNNYAYIEDIAVDVAFRNQGIGTALIQCGKEWARTTKLAGIMLETQNNNGAACMFYESCGFTLRGFDTHLYKGLKDTDEIALYWYYTFS